MLHDCKSRFYPYMVALICCFLVSFPGLTAGVAAEQSIASISQERIKRLDKNFEALVTSGRYMGFTGLIIRDGKIAHQMAMGWQDRKRQIAMDKDTLAANDSCQK